MPDKMPVEVAHYTLNDEVVGILYAGSPKDQTQRIHQYMTSEGFNAGMNSVSSGSWDDVFEEYEVDILLAGNHPDGTDACMKFARHVVQRNPLIDVLVHGIHRMEPATKYDRSLYTEVVTHPGVDYSQQAINMIVSHRKKWNDVIFLRGLFITQVVNIEAHINDALATHFGLGPETARGRQFEEYILENPMYLLEGKKKALFTILKDAGLKHMWKSGMDNKMQMLQSKRNKMAHCEVDPVNANVIESMGKTYRYDRKGMRDALKDARLVRQSIIDIAEALMEQRLSI